VRVTPHDRFNRARRMENARAALGILHYYTSPVMVKRLSATKTLRRVEYFRRLLNRIEINAASAGVRPS